jgi:hypothetical protein
VIDLKSDPQQIIKTILQTAFNKIQKENFFCVAKRAIQPSWYKDNPTLFTLYSEPYRTKINDFLNGTGNVIITTKTAMQNGG